MKIFTVKIEIVVMADSLSEACDQIEDIVSVDGAYWRYAEDEMPKPVKVMPEWCE